MQLPNAEIDKTVRPTDEQKMILVGLQNATTQAAADLIKSTCVANNPLTPAAKLAAVGKRLETMLEIDQGRKNGTQQLLWSAVRRAEGEVRGDRSANGER